MIIHQVSNTQSSNTHQKKWNTNKIKKYLNGGNQNQKKSKKSAKTTMKKKKTTMKKKKKKKTMKT